MNRVEHHYQMDVPSRNNQGTFERTRTGEENIYFYLPNLTNEGEKRDIVDDWQKAVYGLILIELHEMSHWGEGPLTRGKQHNTPWNTYLNHKVIAEVHNFNPKT